MWWDNDRIERAVDRQFVCSQLLAEEIARLDRPLAFGDGLTDGTYLEWIEEKAKKIFLILVDLGVPDQIFGVIDDSWDDDDLPIALDHVERLALTPAKDERSERKFYYRQYYYLLKPLERGEHMHFQDMEVVPVDAVPEKRPGLTLHHSVDRVVLPNEAGRMFSRRRIPIGSGPGCLSSEDFQYEVDNIRNVQNDHLVSYWGSYEHQGYGYVLFTPASDLSLKGFLATTPASVKNLDKQVRRQLVLNWIHCLVDTLCFVHNRGLSHGNIKPSTVLFNSDNHIFYSDFTQLSAESLLAAGDGDGKTSFDKESYDYAAPEQWFRPSVLSALAGPGAPLSRKATLTSLSASPENTTFCISRGGVDHSATPAAMMNAPNPQLNPQAADVFSLGCVIVELLSSLLKRPTRAFATHRAAKHKTPGRGGAVLDSSFHRNLGQVESWMTGLARDAQGKTRKKKDDDAASAAFRGVAPMLHVVERMLALHPTERPSAHDVQRRMYEILRDDCGIVEPHCVHRYGGWDYNLGGLKLGSNPSTPTTEDDFSQMGGSGSGTLSKRNSGGSASYHQQQQHRWHHHHRTDSGGSSGGRSRTEYTRDLPSPTGTGGFPALRQQLPSVRDKVRSPWQPQSPVFAV